MCTSPLARVLCVTHEMPFVSFLCCWELVELGNCKIRISVQCLNVDWLLFDLPLAGPLTACSRSSRGAPPWTACRPSSRWWCWCCCWWPSGTCREWSVLSNNWCRTDALHRYKVPADKIHVHLPLGNVVLSMVSKTLSHHIVPWSHKRIIFWLEGQDGRIENKQSLMLINTYVLCYSVFHVVVLIYSIIKSCRLSSPGTWNNKNLCGLKLLRRMKIVSYVATQEQYTTWWQSTYLDAYLDIS